MRSPNMIQRQLTPSDFLRRASEITREAQRDYFRNRRRLLAEPPEDFPELPHDAVLVITPKIRKQAREFLAYRQRAEPMDQGMPGC